MPEWQHLVHLRAEIVVMFGRKCTANILLEASSDCAGQYDYYRYGDNRHVMFVCKPGNN